MVLFLRVDYVHLASRLGLDLQSDNLGYAGLGSENWEAQVHVSGIEEGWYYRVFYYNEETRAFHCHPVIQKWQHMHVTFVFQ